MNLLSYEICYYINSFLNAKTRGILASCSLSLNYINIAIKKRKSIQIFRIWKDKVLLSKFMQVHKTNQKIKDIVPIIWLLNAACNKSSNRQHARQLVGLRTESRFEFFCDNYHSSQRLSYSPSYSAANKEIAEEYVRNQYVYYPDKTIIDFLNEISIKCKGILINDLMFDTFIKNKNVTLPDLIQNVFTASNFEIYGY